MSNEANPSDIRRKQEMIYVPSVNLHFQPEITHLGFNWFETHEALNKEGLRMPTIPEFKDFLVYSERYYPEVFNEIAEMGEKSNYVWLDARFEEENEKQVISYNHRFSRGKLVPGNREKLEECLMEAFEPGLDLNNWLAYCNRQGLPQRYNKFGLLFYWPPVCGIDSAAKFGRSRFMTEFNCCESPYKKESETGVIACLRMPERIIPDYTIGNKIKRRIK